MTTQPITLRAYDKANNRIININGYEVLQNGHIRIFGTHYNQVFEKITILHSTGQKDNKNEEIFEFDVVHDKKNQVTGIVEFRNGSFYIEGKTKVITDWPPNSDLIRLCNFLTQPLALDTLID